MLRNPLAPFLAVALTVLPACVVYDSDPAGPVADTYVDAGNYAPFIDWADAACGWDPVYYDFVWTFDADVDDWDGLGDVVAVYADVYDTWTGQWQDGFELAPVDGYTWSSAWVGGSTYLDCGYPDYVVDFTAVDSWEATDLVSVYPGYW